MRKIKTLLMVLITFYTTIKKKELNNSKAQLLSFLCIFFYSDLLPPIVTEKDNHLEHMSESQTLISAAEKF